MVDDIDIETLTYLDVVVNECLKLHLVAPLLVPHESMEDIEINGYYVSKKSRLIWRGFLIGSLGLLIDGLSFKSAAWVSDRWLGFANQRLGWWVWWPLLAPIGLMKRENSLCPIPFLNSIPKVSPLTLAIFLLLSIWTFIRILSRPKDNKNQPKLPPGPRSLPIIGNLHMLGSLPHRALHCLAKIYGPIMSLRLGHVPTIVVSSPQAAELFLKTHDTIFASRPKLQVSEYLSYGTKGMAFTKYGSYWRNFRKLCTLQLLCVSKIGSFAPVRKAEVGSLVQSLKKAARGA
ncbi:cytochrome p450 cyp736a12 [Quercus suber]|uniref:Cytochrome p450 cyp736a12 n=1 Tax=Quercus suber TaxID=58331 RepID=A0AAW0KFR0_QUESU